MLPTHRFSELMPRTIAAPSRATLPACAHVPVDREELQTVPAFDLMRLVRDWVEGEDDAGAGLWLAGSPSRLYEYVDGHRLCAAHAVIGFLSASPGETRLSDVTLMHASCKKYWPPDGWSPAQELEGEVTDERPPGWARLAPWWRTASMFRDEQVDLAAIGLHYLWMTRHERDLASLAAHTPVDGGLLRSQTVRPPLHLRAAMEAVLEPSNSDRAPFARAVLDELRLDSTLAEASTRPGSPIGNTSPDSLTSNS